MLFVIIISCAVILLGVLFAIRNVRLRNNSDQLRPNRYKRKHKIQYEPTINPIDESPSPSQTKPVEPEYTVIDDADEVLGLKVEPQQDKIENKQSVPSIITCYVLAEQDRYYEGYELLQALLAIGLRFGEGQIFHRHEQKTGRGDILFSLASITEPGTFELSKMGGFSCGGLCLFLQLHKVKDPLQAYDIMLETAEQLVEDLGGVVLDDERKPYGKDKMVQQRKQIRQYSGNHRTADMFNVVD